MTPITAAKRPLDMTVDPWVEMLALLARHYGLATSPEAASVALQFTDGRPLEDVLGEAAREMGLQARMAAGAQNFKRWSLPVILELTGGRAALLKHVAGAEAVVVYSGAEGLATPVKTSDLAREVTGRLLVARPDNYKADARVDEFTRPYRKSWFWSVVLRHWPRYGEVFLASLVINVLGLAATVFSMQVFDRVVPAQSEATLWVLLAGVAIAALFGFLLKIARTRLSDRIGKASDLAFSSFFFGRALRIRNDARPKSTGAMIAQLREIEQVRELLTSVTVSALADLPFVMLFMVVLWYIGGPAVWVLVAALPLLLVPGLLVQPYLARLSRTGIRESGIRNAILVEAIECVEDIKMLRAERRFQNQWDKCNDVAANVGLRQRFVAALLVGWTQEIQTLVYIGVIAVGVYQVLAGNMTTGALIGASILASRTIAPLAMLATLFSRWQQAKVAREGLDNLLQKPTDRPERGTLLHRPVLRGHYQLRDVAFQYSKEAKAPALRVQSLEIRAGERVAILGRVGAGKSTLLQLMAGMAIPQNGQILLDGTDLELIDPSDVRRDIGLLGQQSRLFYGTLRDNLLMGQPNASDEQVLAALQVSGASALVQGHAQGLDAMLSEGGQGLSGGQRQALLLARTILRNPRIVLLDEPTASFDDGLEMQFVRAFNAWSPGRTVVISTHRYALLNCVDRIVVVEGGQVVLDGPKQQVLERLNAAAVTSAPAPAGSEPSRARVSPVAVVK